MKYTPLYVKPAAQVSLLVLGSLIGKPVVVKLGLLLLEETPPDITWFEPVICVITDAFDCNDLPKNSDYVSD